MQVGENSVKSLFYSIALFIVLFIALRLFKKVVLVRVKKLASKTSNKFDDFLASLIESIPNVFYIVMALYFSLKNVMLGETVSSWLNGVFIVAIVYVLVEIAQSLIDYLLVNFSGKKESKEEHSQIAFQGIRLIIKIVLWSIGALLILSNLGFNITSLVTSLGIGGIAVALAVQNILGDIFSSFSLYFDKPFQVGDFIIAGEHSGKVKKIGLKSTRLETLQGEELVISNKELTTSRVQNFKKLKRRRVALNFGVVYETPVKKLKKINDIVRKIIEGVKDVEFGRSHFSQFASSSLNFEVIYFVESQEYDVYMDKQQEINFKIKESFEAEKIEMAYPTQTLYLNK